MVNHAQLSVWYPTNSPFRCLGQLSNMVKVWSKSCGVVDDQGPTKKKHVGFPRLLANASYLVGGSHNGCLLTQNSHDNSVFFDHETWELHFHHGSCHSWQLEPQVPLQPAAAQVALPHHLAVHLPAALLLVAHPAQRRLREIGAAKWDDEGFRRVKGMWMVNSWSFHCI